MTAMETDADIHKDGDEAHIGLPGDFERLKPRTNLGFGRFHEREEFLFEGSNILRIYASPPAFFFHMERIAFTSILSPKLHNMQHTRLIAECYKRTNRAFRMSLEMHGSVVTIS